MLTDIVTDNFTNADHPVTTCHDLTVTVDAIHSVDGCDEGSLASLVREMS